MAKNGLLDDDFIDDGDELDTGKHERWSPPEPVEVETKKPVKEKEDDLGFKVEISDDTPEEDKGKWVADEKDEPEFPTDDEVKTYAKGAQKRIATMTARIHAERRAREQTARENAEAVELARRLIAENNQLKDFVNNGEKVLMGEHKGRLQAMVEQAKTRYKEAHDAGDVAGQIAAQEQLSQAIAKIERAAGQRPLNLQKQADPFANRQPQPEQPQVDPKAQAWAEKNTWFGKDSAMTGYALGYHKQLTENEGILPDQPEYYQRLDKEMRTRFAEKFNGGGNGQARRAPPPVGAVSRTGSAAPRTVRITESQARLAKRLGLTVEQYAQQIVAEQDQRNAGESRSFTHQ